MNNRQRLLLWVCIWGTLSGCGYRMGSLTPHGVKTVAVPVLANYSLFRGYEFTLTRAIVSDLLTQTSLQVTTVEQADIVLEAAILDVEQRTVTKDENRLATQLDVELTVAVTWKDRRTDKLVLPQQVVSEEIEIITTAGETLEDAIAQALRKVSRQIVYTLEAPYLLAIDHEN